MSGRDWAMIGVGAVTSAALVVGFGRAYPSRGVVDNDRASMKDALAKQESSKDRSVGEESMHPRATVPAEQSSFDERADDKAALVVNLQRQMRRVSRKLEEARTEKRDLQAQMRSLADELERRPPEENPVYEYEMDQDEWKELAAQGGIKYRIPCMLPVGASWPPPDELDELGLSPDDGDIITGALMRSKDRVWEAIRPICVQETGDADLAEVLGPMKCLGLIEQAAAQRDLAEAAAARRQVAEVHAGLRSAPAEGESQRPLFSALMAVTREAGLFESDLADSFGPEEAKRIWQSMSCVATRR